MQQMAVCPNCRVLLTTAADDPSVMSCSKCSGQFLRSNFSLETIPEILPTVEESAEIEPHLCPDCLAPMDLFERSAQLRFVCAACGGVWIEENTAQSIETSRELSVPVKLAEKPDDAGFMKSLMYGVSLPERMVRTAIGVTAGTAREAAKLLVPVSFQTSKSYEVAIRNSLDFLTETVGGFQTVSSETGEASEHLAKKAIGNFVDIAGIAALHISPMWVMAAVSDIAYGSSSYLKEVAKELEKQGVIDEASTIHNVDDFLEAIQQTSGRVATSIDKPPLSVNEFRQFVTETRASVANADVRKILPQHEVQQYWESLQQVAGKENITLFEAATAVAMHTAQQTSNIAVGATTGFRVAGGLLQKNVIQHYQDSLGKLRQEGFLNVLRATYQPYAALAWNNFSSERKSWTESLLDPGNMFKLFGVAKPPSEVPSNANAE